MMPSDQPICKQEFPVVPMRSRSNGKIVPGQFKNQRRYKDIARSIKYKANCKIDVNKPTNDQMFTIKLALIVQFAPTHYGRKPNPSQPQIANRKKAVMNYAFKHLSALQVVKRAVDLVRAGKVNHPTRIFAIHLDCINALHGYIGDVVIRKA